MTSYETAKQAFDAIAKSVAEKIDYDIASLGSTLENEPTIYKGKGRPRKSDYAIYKHPFDGKLTKELNRF